MGRDFGGRPAQRLRDRPQGRGHVLTLAGSQIRVGQDELQHIGQSGAGGKGGVGAFVKPVR
jgi:hypothetical protein